MITSVVFFLIIGLVVVVGVSETVVRDLKNAQNIVKARESFAVGEALHEDVVYRFKQSMQVGSSETLTLNGYTASSTVLDIVGGKRVTTSADRTGYIKRVMSDLFSGAGTSFNYGVQTGEGGLILEGSSSVTGNVYSNGPVVGNGNVSSNSINPSLVGTVSVGPTAYKMVWSAPYIYVVNENTVQTVNASNPSAPAVVSTVTNGGQQKDIALANGHLFVTATNSNLVRAMSLSNPSTPVSVGTVAVTGPGSIKIVGSYAYVLSNTGSHTLKTINISNPTAMTVVSTLNTVSTFPVGMSIQGTYLYVISQGGTSKLEIYSIANPASPTLVSATTLASNPITISVAGLYAYIDVYACGCIQVWNISNPAAPVIVSSTSVNSVNNGHSLHVAGSYLYAAVYYGTKEFQVWDISNPNSLSKLNTNNIAGGNPVHIISGQPGYIYLLTQNNNANSPLNIYRISGSGGSMIYGDVVSAGPSGSVDRINASSSIYSKTITNSLAGGSAYFKNISNTTVLGTSFSNSADQATSSMPISDAVIDQWKADAEAAGVITTPCPYKITGSSVVTLGPIKINCDLEVSNSSTLYLGGMVWVKGNVTLSNSGTIQIAPSISGRTAAIIADDPANRSSGSTIKISNSTSYLGSGTNSYVMLVSRNTSAQNGGGVKAIEVSNSVSGKLLVYAPHGEILLQNSASIKEVTGWRTRLQNSATVIYETGLANLIFTSGPSGGYQIGSWGEVE
jgi:hypothetical protein